LTSIIAAQINLILGLGFESFGFTWRWVHRLMASIFLEWALVFFITWRIWYRTVKVSAGKK